MLFVVKDTREILSNRENRLKNISSNRMSLSVNGLNEKSICSIIVSSPSNEMRCNQSFSTKSPIRLLLKSTTVNRGQRISTSVCNSRRKHSPSSKLDFKIKAFKWLAFPLNNQPIISFTSPREMETPSTNNTRRLCAFPSRNASKNFPKASVIWGLLLMFNRFRFSAKGEQTNSINPSKSLAPIPVWANSNSSNNGQAPIVSTPNKLTIFPTEMKLSVIFSFFRLGQE